MLAFKKMQTFSTLIFVPWMNPQKYNQHLQQKFTILREQRGHLGVESDLIKRQAFPDRYDFDSIFAVTLDAQERILASARLTTMERGEFPFEEVFVGDLSINAPPLSRLNHFMISDLLIPPENMELIGYSDRLKLRQTVLEGLLSDVLYYLQQREYGDVVWCSSAVEGEVSLFLALGFQVSSSPFRMEGQNQVMMSLMINDRQSLLDMQSPLAVYSTSSKPLYIQALATRELLGRKHRELLPEVLVQLDDREHRSN